MKYHSALTNELRTIIVIHSHSVYSQTRLADFGYILECKSKNPRGLNEVSLPLARMTYDVIKARNVHAERKQPDLSQIFTGTTFYTVRAMGKIRIIFFFRNSCI